jgi:hypothetical protein
MARNIILTLTVLVAAFYLGYRLAPREAIDTEVTQAGAFTTDTARVLSATVRSLKAESKLVVFSFTGDTRVSVSRSRLWGILQGSQELIVPATVGYFLPMDELGQEDVTLDGRAKTVLVKLPKLRLGDIAFQPERARKTNGGLLTYSGAVADELERANYATARRAFVRQAQGAVLVSDAKAQAIKSITTYFEIPLRAVGDPDIKVRAYFP